MSDDRRGVERSAHSKHVDSRNPELVLIGFDQLGGVKGAFLALIRNHGPRYLGRLTLLNDVVGNLRAAIILWRAPGQCAPALGDAAEGDGSHRLPRGVCIKILFNVMYIIFHSIYV